MTIVLPLRATEVAGEMLAGTAPCLCCGDLVYRGRLAFRGDLCGDCFASREADRDHGNREPEHWDAECPPECMAYTLGDDGEPLACYHLVTHAARRIESAHYVYSIIDRAGGSAEASAANREGPMTAKSKSRIQASLATVERDTYTCGSCDAHGLVAGEPHVCETPTTVPCRDCGKRPAGERDSASPFCGACDPNGGRFYDLANVPAEDTGTFPCPVPGCVAILSGSGSDHDCPQLAALENGTATIGETVVIEATPAGRSKRTRTARQTKVDATPKALRVIPSSDDRKAKKLAAERAFLDRCAAAVAATVARATTESTLVTASGNMGRWHLLVDDAPACGVTAPWAHRSDDLNAITHSFCQRALKEIRANLA